MSDSLSIVSSGAGDVILGGAGLSSDILSLGTCAVPYLSRELTWANALMLTIRLKSASEVVEI